MADQKLGTTYVDITGRKRPLFKALDAAKVKVGTAVKKMAAQLGKLQKRMGKLGKSMSTRVTLPIVAAFALATRSAMRYEAAMRNVNVIARQNEKQFKKTSEEVLKMAQELGKSPVDLANALYNINSAGFTAARGLKVLRQSIIAAKAGLSDTATAAKTITSILNAYGLGVEKAADVSDILFKTIEKGVTTFPELGSSLGNVISTAAAAKIPFDQVSAALATMTKGGISTSEAVTALNMMILGIIKPSNEMKKAIKQFGFESGAAIIKARGLGGIMEFLQQATGGTAEGAAKLGLRVRALKAVLSLTRNEGKAFAEDLENIANEQNRMGSTTDALKEQSKTLQFQWDKMKAAISVLAIRMGNSLAPVVKLLIGLVTTLSQAFSGLAPWMRTVIVTLAGIAAAAGPALLAFSLLTKAFIAFNVQVAWLMANPIVFVAAAVIASIVALGMAVSDANKHTREAIAINKEYRQSLGDAKTGSEAYDAASVAIEKTKTKIKELEQETSGWWGTWKGLLFGGTNLLGDMREELHKLIEDQARFGKVVVGQKKQDRKDKKIQEQQELSKRTISNLKELLAKESKIEEGWKDSEIEKLKKFEQKKKEIQKKFAEDMQKTKIKISDEELKNWNGKLTKRENQSVKTQENLRKIRDIELQDIIKQEDEIKNKKAQRSIAIVQDALKSLAKEEAAEKKQEEDRKKIISERLAIEKEMSKSFMTDDEIRHEGLKDQASSYYTELLKRGKGETKARSAAYDWQENEEIKRLASVKGNLAILEAERAALHKNELERRAEEKKAMVGFVSLQSIFQKAQVAGARERFNAPSADDKGMSRGTKDQIKRLDEQIKLQKTSVKNQEIMIQNLSQADIGGLL